MAEGVQLAPRRKPPRIRRPHRLVAAPRPSSRPADVPGWGTFPANDDSRAVKEMEARLADERRQREREEDNRRRQDERDERRREQEEQRRRDDARDAQMMKLFESLHAKPTGPSETRAGAAPEIEETKRRLEEQTREEARRREDQAREDRYREDRPHSAREDRSPDARDPREGLRPPRSADDADGDDHDSTQAQASESVRAVREAAAVASSANERHTSQIMEAMTRDKTGASEMTRQMLEGSKTMMEMQSSFYQQMLEQANSGGAPWYATAIQGALEKIGPIANAVAARAQQPQQQVMPAAAPAARRARRRPRHHAADPAGRPAGRHPRPPGARSHRRAARGRAVRCRRQRRSSFQAVPAIPATACRARVRRAARLERDAAEAGAGERAEPCGRIRSECRPRRRAPRPC